MAMSIEIINHVNENLSKLIKGMENISSMSVSEASNFCGVKAKINVPKKTGATMNNIFVLPVEKRDGVTIGKVVSYNPSSKTPFLLNIFLETSQPVGSTSGLVKGKPYKLRSGVFGFMQLSGDETAPYFKGLIYSRGKSVIDITGGK